MDYLDGGENNMTTKSSGSAERNGTETAEHRNDAGNSVDRIRDIIFGEQIQDYGAKFDKIWTQLSTIDQRLERINEKIAEQERDLDSQLENQKKKFAAELSQLDSDFSRQLADAALESQEKADALAQTITALSKSTKMDLTKTAAQLTNLKMDRAALGDMFVLLGQNLISDNIQSESTATLSDSKTELTKASTKSSSTKSTAKSKATT